MDLLPFSILYNLPELQRTCESVIRESTNIYNVSFIYQLAIETKCMRLKTFCEYYILTHWDQMEEELYDTIFQHYPKTRPINHYLCIIKKTRQSIQTNKPKSRLHFGLFLKYFFTTTIHNNQRADPQLSLLKKQINPDQPDHS